MNITINLEGFDRIEKDLEKEISQIQTFLLDTFQQEVKQRTPIDKGRARAGWQKRSNAVSNQVPYIERLERGYSRQAPRGFVNQAISATIQKTKRIIK